MARRMLVQLGLHPGVDNRARFRRHGVQHASARAQQQRVHGDSSARVVCAVGGAGGQSYAIFRGAGVAGHQLRSHTGVSRDSVV